MNPAVLYCSESKYQIIPQYTYTPKPLSKPSDIKDPVQYLENARKIYAEIGEYTKISIRYKTISEPASLEQAIEMTEFDAELYILETMGHFKLNCNRGYRFEGLPERIRLLATLGVDLNCPHSTNNPLSELTGHDRFNEKTEQLLTLFLELGAKVNQPFVTEDGKLEGIYQHTGGNDEKVTEIFKKLIPAFDINLNYFFPKHGSPVIEWLSYTADPFSHHLKEKAFKRIDLLFRLGVNPYIRNSDGKTFIELYEKSGKENSNINDTLTTLDHEQLRQKAPQLEQQLIELSRAMMHQTPK